MPVVVTRSLLQLVYLEQHGSPRTPNALRELLGLIDVRAGGEAAAPNRKTLHLDGAAHLHDDAVARNVKISCGGDVVIEPQLVGPGSWHDYNPTQWDDASIALITLSGAKTITGFDAFSCRRWEKLIVNVSGGILTIAHASTSSLVDNRVLCQGAANLLLDPGEAAWLIRDRESARWRAKSVLA